MLKSTPSSLRGNLLGLLTALFYMLFTLLPNSSSLMVSWPWVFLWQVALLCPVLWWVGQQWQGSGQWLGKKLDWLAAALGFGIVISTVFAAFPMSARWYGWAALCGLVALYAVNNWLGDRPIELFSQRCLGLLQFQGYLVLTFIALSLLLWATQTWQPEVERLQALRSSGVNLAFSLARNDSRNWAPIGHQNYVAGYLVLGLPLLVGLGLRQAGWHRWLWWGGVVLGLVALYTTGSRGGWLGLLLGAIAAVGLALTRRALSKRWLLLGGGGLALLVAIMVTNDRLRTLIGELASGQASGELAYRLITNTIGGRMGLSQVASGIGLGGVPFLYQHFRPAWAGREAELTYQLHSTPAQVWAELGLWGGIVGLGTIAWVVAQTTRWIALSSNERGVPKVLIGSLAIGLVSYVIVALTDYQLDNLSISGTVLLYLAVLAATLKRPSSEAAIAPSPSKIGTRALPLAMLGLVAAILVWLVPVHRAWMLSSQGFSALAQQNITTLVDRLSQAHQLVPWEPYYANQLGWILGDLALQSPADQQKTLLPDAIAWVQRSLQASPHQEFAHSNLGWLHLANSDPNSATQAFMQSAALVPAKRGVFTGLGTSLLAQGNSSAAIDAFALEILRDPIALTSPAWDNPVLQPIIPQLVQRLESRYTSLLQQAAGLEPLTNQLLQSRGLLYWWTGNVTKARADWEKAMSSVGQAVLDLAIGKPVAPELTSASPGMRTIAAWLTPAQRPELLAQAWILANREAPPEFVLQQLVSTMNAAKNFDQWVKQLAPTRQYRRERLGFGLVSRHLDGVTPRDFYTVSERIAIAQLLNELFPPLLYSPQLDNALERDRTALLNTIQLRAR